MITTILLKLMAYVAYLYDWMSQNAPLVKELLDEALQFGLEDSLINQSIQEEI